MTPAQAEDILATLNDINHRLQSSLQAFADSSGTACTPSVAAPEQIAQWLEYIKQGHKLFQAIGGRGDIFQQQFAAFRHNVERLRKQLPFVHKTLRQERARLENDTERMRTASEWARSSRQTL